MSCVLSPGHGAHCALRLLLFHAYYSESICQRTLPFSKPFLMQDCGCPDHLLYKIKGLTFASLRENWIKTIKVSWAEQESNLYLILRKDALCPLSYQSVQTEFSLSPSVSHRYGRNNKLIHHVMNKDITFAG